MKNKPFLLALFLLNFSFVFARGFEPLGAKFYILEDDELHVWDTLTGKTIKIFKVATDSHCVNSLARTEIANGPFNISYKDSFTKSISKMHCMGLIAHNKEIMLTVRYIISKVDLKYRYALLKFDVNLKLLNQYLLIKDDNCQYFGFISYSTPEFKSANEFYHPNFRNDNIFLDGFVLDDKAHKIKLSSFGSEPIQHSTLQLLVSKGQLLNPIVNTVGNAHYNWVYEYPYAVIYDRNDKVTDPFRQQHLKDSLSRTESLFVVNLRSYNPELFKEKLNHVIICTHQRGQNLMMMTTDSVVNSVILMRIDLETGKVLKQSIAMDIGENQFKLIGDRLYMVKKANNKFHVTYKYLEELMKP